MVRYFGPLTLKAGETRTETFTLPPYMGALRIMVVAASSGAGVPGQRSRAYGTAERTVPVSSDLMVFGTVPRTLSPGDEAVIPVSVYSYLAGRRTVTVNFTAEGAAHDWGSNYAGHFLIEAKRAGYAVPASLIENWIGFQRGRAAGWSGRDNSQLDQAYRLYTLALAGSGDLGSMNRLREQRELNPAAAWRLAAAYWYAGQRDTARSMIKRLDTGISDYRELSGTFGSSLRDKAMMLETMTVAGDSDRIGPVYQEVSQALSSEVWLSTQERTMNTWARPGCFTSWNPVPPRVSTPSPS